MLSVQSENAKSEGTFQVTMLPGDGVGPELMHAVKEVFKVRRLPLGGTGWREKGGAAAAELVKGAADPETLQDQPVCLLRCKREPVEL